MQAIYNTLPYRQVPLHLIIEMAKHTVFWLNAFWQPNGIGGNQSPQSIVVGTNINYSRHCKYQFGEYVQTHKEHDNSMMPWMIGTLALCPTGKDQGSFHFFSLSTGRVITQNWATPLPMPDDVINQVNWIALSQKANPGLIFTDCAQCLSEAVNEGEEADSEDDSSYLDGDASDGSDDEWDSAEHNHYVNDDPGEQMAGVDDQEDQRPVEIMNADKDQIEEQNNVKIAGVCNKQELEMAGVPEVQEVEDNDDDAGWDVCRNDEDQRQLETEMDAKYGQQSGR